MDNHSAKYQYFGASCGPAEIAMQGVRKLQVTFSHLLLVKPSYLALSSGKIFHVKLLLPPRSNHWVTFQWKRSFLFSTQCKSKTCKETKAVAQPGFLQYSQLWTAVCR